MPSAPPEFVTFLTSELAGIGPCSASRFFGGWQLRIGDQQVAIVMKGTVFLRVDPALQAELDRLGSRPFSYQKSGKTSLVPKYMSLPEEALDDPDLLRVWMRRVIEP